LEGLAPSVEDISFGYCGLDEDKATAFRELLPRLASLKEVDFSQNRNLSVDGWRRLLEVLAPSVEDISVAKCELDDGDASVFCDLLPRFQVAAWDFTGNPSISLVMIASIVFVIAAARGWGGRTCSFSGSVQESGVPAVSELSSALALEFNPSLHCGLQDQTLSWLQGVKLQKVCVVRKQSSAMWETLLTNVDPAVE